MKMIFFSLWVLCVIATVALAIKPGGIPMHTGADKMLHLLVFCILMLWPATTFDKLLNVALGAIFLFSVGLGMEYLQSFIPGRSADFMDVASNGLGILAGVVIGFLFRESYQSLLPMAYIQAYLKPSR